MCNMPRAGPLGLATPGQWSESCPGPGKREGGDSQCEAPTTASKQLKGPRSESTNHREMGPLKPGWNKGWAQHSNQFNGGGSQGAAYKAITNEGIQREGTKPRSQHGV